MSIWSVSSTCHREQLSWTFACTSRCGLGFVCGVGSPGGRPGPRIPAAGLIPKGITLPLRGAEPPPGHPPCARAPQPGGHQYVSFIFPTAHRRCPPTPRVGDTVQVHWFDSWRRWPPCAVPRFGSLRAGEPQPLRLCRELCCASRVGAHPHARPAVSGEGGLPASPSPALHSFRGPGGGCLPARRPPCSFRGPGGLPASPSPSPAPESERDAGCCIFDISDEHKHRRFSKC